MMRACASPICAYRAFITGADMKIFIRERLNGYYGVSQFTVSNTLASLPFILLIAVVSTVCGVCSAPT
jgi:hypothetical protein